MALFNLTIDSKLRACDATHNGDVAALAATVAAGTRRLFELLRPALERPTGRCRR